MKNLVKISLVLAAAALTLSGCNCFKKMGKKQDEVTYSCTPKVLTLNNGVVSADITVNFPAAYFNKKATLRLTPVIVFEGGEVAGTPKYVQGEKVNDNYTVISADNGGTYTQHVEFPYDDRMEQSELRVLIESKCNGASEYVMFNAATGKPVTKEEAAVLANPKSAEAMALRAQCGVFIAEGVNTMQRDFNFGDAAATAANNYKRTTNQVDKAEILYKINSSVVNQKALKENEQLSEFEKTAVANKENDRIAQSLYVNGYASPDGPEKFNDKLASARSETGRKAVEKILAEYGFNIDAAGYGEDWEGFKEMVEKSNIQDKDLILQVLSMYDSSAERENQIKNMSSVYGELKEDVLPKLRRAQLVNNMEITGKSDAEMQALVNSGKLDELNNEELLHVATLIEDNALKVKVLEYAAKKYDDSRAYTNLGAAYLQMDDADKALAALTQAVKLGGNTQELNSNLALANLAAGNVDEAKKYAAAADAQTKAMALRAQCGVFIAEGVNTMQRDFNFGDAAATAANNYKRTTNQVDKAEILYKINSSVVNQKALKENEQLSEFEKTAVANKENDRIAQSLYVNGYASPDGPEKFNDKLASARSETGRKAVEKILAEYGFNIDAAGYGEDWEGFKEMVEKSNIQDKDLILQVLSMYDSSAERENQIKNMSSVYGELKEDVLPKLRRAQLVNNMEITGKSDAEMQALVNSGKLDELNNEELLHVATLIEDNALKVKVLEYAAKKYDDSRAYTNLGAAYLQMDDADKALAALTQAVKLGGNTQELNSNLALANLAAGNVDEAKKYAAAADAQTKSLIAAAQGQYGDAAAKLKGYNAAVAAVMNNDLSAAKKALAGENSADADYLRAVIATKEGDMKTAGAQLKAAVAKDSALVKKASKDVNLKPLFKSGFKF